MSKTIFISQPMGGLSDEQVLQERTAAISKAKALLGEDVAPLETFFDDFGPAAKPLDYLARAADVYRRRVEKDQSLKQEKGQWGDEAYIDMGSGMQIRSPAAMAPPPLTRISVTAPPPPEATAAVVSFSIIVSE